MIYVLPEINPVALQIGPLAIRWYSLAYIAGILYTIWWLKFRNQKQQFMSAHAFENWLSWAVLSVILGGRIGYVLFYNFSYFLHHPLEIFAVWQGGMSFHGGLLGAILGMWFFSKKYQIDFWKLMDHLAIAAPLGLFFGRLANFVNMELFGRATKSTFGVVFPNGGNFPRHPSQLYEALLEGILLFLVLNFCYFKTSLNPSNQSSKKQITEKISGKLSGVFLIGYGLARIVVENFREPDTQIGFIFGNSTMGQLLCLPLILIGIWLLVFRKLKNHKI